MACRVGMSTDPDGRMAYWKTKENCLSGRVVASKLTYDEALAMEKSLAEKDGCRYSGGGQRVSGRVWSVYRMSYCD